MNRLVIGCELTKNVAYEFSYRLVSLGCTRAGHVDLHVSFLEYHSVAKHPHSQVFVEICISTLRVLRTTVLWYVSCAV